MDTRDELIPLSDAAKYAGCTPAYLNMLARQGKLLAKKVGRNWQTTRSWVDECFGRVTTAPETSENGLEIRKVEKDERVELAKVEAEKLVELRRIEKDEKVELARLGSPVAAPSIVPSETVTVAADSAVVDNKTDRVNEAVAQVQEQIKSL